MSDLGDLHHNLGNSVIRDSKGLFLSQQKYSSEILDRAGMLHRKPNTTPANLSSKLDGTGPRG